MASSILAGLISMTLFSVQEDCILVKMGVATDGIRFGLHRVLDTPKRLPQQAHRLDPTGPLARGEVRIAVDRLCIDSTSFVQLMSEVGADGISEHIVSIVKERGKMHNPVTQSGGMLLGTVTEIGASRNDVEVGSRVSTLVSLTLTPLVIKQILRIDHDAHTVDIEGEAILFESGTLVTLPEDISEQALLKGLDVCGAPALVKAMAKDRNVLILGASGTSGKLCIAAAADSGATRIVGCDISQGPLLELVRAGLLTEFHVHDVRDSFGMLQKVNEQFDLTVSCVSTPYAEAAAIMLTKHSGRIVFFSTATNFCSAALIAEGIGSPVEMLIGNGYQPDHALYTIELLRRYPHLLSEQAC